MPSDRTSCIEQAEVIKQLIYPNIADLASPWTFRAYNFFDIIFRVLLPCIAFLAIRDLRPFKNQLQILC